MNTVNQDWYHVSSNSPSSSPLTNSSNTSASTIELVPNHHHYLEHFSYTQSTPASIPIPIPIAHRTNFNENPSSNLESMGQTYLKSSLSSSSASPEQFGFTPTNHNHYRHHYSNQPSSFFLSPITSNDSQASTLNSLNSTLTNSNDIDHKHSGENFSPLLSLPIEILYKIIEIVYYDDNTNSINSSLEKFSKTVPLLSKTVNQLSLRFLYKYAIFNRPHSFDKFLNNLISQPELGNYVEFMDWQTFTSIGLGRTGRMNQEIQMVTSNTITKALSLTPNLIEFLASENIQDDMDINVLNMLFKNLPKIQSLDFCGASSEKFANAFIELQLDDQDENQIDQDELMSDDENQIINNINKNPTSLSNLFKISFHDCSNLPASVFSKILPSFKNLRRLDLTHTSITSTILLEKVPYDCRLTHLSLARCSKLTTKDLINFLTNHPAVSNDSLQWLNLQIDLNVVSPLTDVYLLYTLKHLKASNLKYLNIGGLPINNRILHIIKSRFPLLESLTISHSTNLEVNDLNEFLKDNIVLKHFDFTGCKQINRWKLINLLKTNFDLNLKSLEFDYKTLYELTTGDYIKIEPLQQSFLEQAPPQIWKFYDNEGRRAWIYKLDESNEEYKSIISGNSKNRKSLATSNLVYYDLETGAKIETKIVKPDFLKYASRKINCSIGYYNLNLVKKKTYLKNEVLENVWPVEFSQRGIYNYYSLNIK